MTTYHKKFQSTHPVRGATIFAGISHLQSKISIHAPRAGCDDYSGELIDTINISIHAPRAGCDPWWNGRTARGSDFNPRTPCGVRHPAPTMIVYPSKISIHAPRAGCDKERDGRLVVEDVFQSTHPVRGATGVYGWTEAEETISIHAPRAGCDAPVKFYEINGKRFQSTHPVRGATRPGKSNTWGSCYFNPRTPCGVRPLTGGSD